MSALDFLGLKKGLAPEGPGAEPSPKAPGANRRLWVGLAAADAALVLVCAAVLAVRVTGHLSAPPKAPAPGRQAPKTAPKVEAPKAEPAKAEPSKTEPAKAEAKKEEPPKAEAKKPEPPKAEAKKPEPPKAEAKKPEPPKAEAPKAPLGRPSVLATPPPARTASPKATTEAPPKPSPGVTPAGKNRTRPVPFSYAAADAKEVYLMGPFLVRSGGRKMMFKDSRGLWAATVYLNIGQTYKYRFEVVEEKGKRMTPSQTVEVLPGD